MHKPLLLLILMLSAGFAGAQTFNQPRMDSLLQAASANEQAMGSLAMMKKVRWLQ